MQNADRSHDLALFLNGNTVNQNIGIFDSTVKALFAACKSGGNKCTVFRIRDAFGHQFITQSGANGVGHFHCRGVGKLYNAIFVHSYDSLIQRFQNIISHLEHCRKHIWFVAKKTLFYFTEKLRRDDKLH